MSYITRNLKATITYWSPGTPDGTGGVSFGAPSSIKARWEDRTTLFIDVAGEDKVSNARVYVNTDVENKGYLFDGESTAASPLTVTGSRQIEDFRKIPNLQYTEFERRALL